MERVLLDEVISTDYGQFDLIWADDRFFRGQDNGLVGAADPGGMYLNLARPLRWVTCTDRPRRHHARQARFIVGGRCRGVHHRPGGQQRALVLMGR